MREVLAHQLDVALALEAAIEVRVRRAALTALLSGPLAALALWPQLFSDVGRRAVLTFWSFSAVATLWALGTEWRLRLGGAAGRGHD